MDRELRNIERDFAAGDVDLETLRKYKKRVGIRILIGVMRPNLLGSEIGKDNREEVWIYEGEDTLKEIERWKGTWRLLGELSGRNKVYYSDEVRKSHVESVERDREAHRSPGKIQNYS